MSLTFRILPAKGLVYVKYRGEVTPAQTARVFAEYARHADRRPGQKQLVDLSDVAAISADYADVMAMQARKADTFLEGGATTLIAYYAPTPVSWRMSAMILKSWEGLPGLVARVFHDEEAALDFLGLRERNFEALLQTA